VHNWLRRQRARGIGEEAAWIYEVDSHEEVERLLARSPVFNFAHYDVYPLADMGSGIPISDTAAQ
jgi:muconolactone delta-isomerase